MVHGRRHVEIRRAVAIFYPHIVPGVNASVAPVDQVHVSITPHVGQLLVVIVDVVNFTDTPDIVLGVVHVAVSGVPAVFIEIGQTVGAQMTKLRPNMSFNYPEAMQLIAF